MQKTGTADLPLHRGRAPRWLFEKMRSLAREITIAIVSDLGNDKFMEKVSDPLWFQALGCVLGFDWHSSGLTTTVCGALKEGLKGLERDLGFFVAGGKGKVSLNTPREILRWGDLTGFDADPFVYASRMTAKVDTAGLQDGFDLYHHCFIFSSSGNWAVIQQGMNENTRYARRYHWISSRVESFVSEPHSAICSEVKAEGLNMVARESKPSQVSCTEIVQESPSHILKDLRNLGKANSIKFPSAHNFPTFELRPKRLEKTLRLAYERSPQNFEQLLGTRGVGAKTIRALALISDLIYGAKPSFRDPTTYSFAHGGKDGYPYPVDRHTYRESILTLHKALQEAKVGRSDKIKALKRLKKFLD